MSTEKILKGGLLLLLTAGFMSLGYAQVYEFDNCGAEGRYGPDPGDCDYESHDVEIVGEGIQEWTAPEDGVYRIEARGAQGGSNAAEGAVIQGEVELDPGQDLQILVGQTSGTAAGGGGSFVATGDSYQTAEPLIVAGGGGGDGDYTSPYRGATSTCGTEDGGDDVDKVCDGEGGNTFSGGNSREGGGGGGYYEEGGVTGHSDLYMPAEPFIEGGEGNTGGRSVDVGGFGGGSHGNAGGWGQAGGGGGGYSGGAGGAREGPPLNGGGGGGSFIANEATDPATSDGNWETTGNEPDDPFKGEVESLSEWNEGHGEIIIEFKGTREICNFRGPFNECVMNETNQLQEQEYNVSSVFESRSNAVLEAFDGLATLSLENTTRISGLWRGQISIESEQPRLEAGAEFRPEGERIVIGN